MRLYHFTSLDTFLRHILPAKTLRSSSLANMNDPRESHNWSFGSINLPFAELFPGYYNDKTHIYCQFKFGQMIKERFQIVCFSGAKYAGWNNEMMWSHYADGQKGICLEFDEEELLNEIRSAFPETVFQLRDVVYGKERKRKPWINWNANLTRDENFDNFLEVLSRDVIFSKSEFWEREDEKRLVFLNQVSNLFIPVNRALKAVHIGLGISKTYHEDIYQAVTEAGLKLYVMVYDNDKYKRWNLTKKEEQWWTSRD